MRSRVAKINYENINTSNTAKGNTLDVATIGAGFAGLNLSSSGALESTLDNGTILIVIFFMLRIQTLQFLIVAIAWTPSSAYGQTHVIAANSNNNKNNVDFSSLSPASTPTNAEMDLAMEREITTAV